MTGVSYGYYPQGRFAFPRSYVAGILVSDQAPQIQQFGNQFRTIIDISVEYWITYLVDERFMAWSSNRWTLDYIVTSCSWAHTAYPGTHDQGYIVNFTYWGDPPLPVVELRNPFLVTNQVFFPLEQAPSNYWLPPYNP